MEDVSSSVETGDIAEEVVRVAERIDADLILIGVRATSSWERVRDGYIPGEIASTAGCPVIVLEVDEERLTAPDQTLRHPEYYN
jgi:nucleotide-binding universal stress UspA family protein